MNIVLNNVRKLNQMVFSLVKSSFEIGWTFTKYTYKIGYDLTRTSNNDARKAIAANSRVKVKAERKQPKIVTEKRPKKSKRLY